MSVEPHIFRILVVRYAVRLRIDIIREVDEGTTEKTSSYDELKTAFRARKKMTPPLTTKPEVFFANMCVSRHVLKTIIFLTDPRKEIKEEA